MVRIPVKIAAIFGHTLIIESLVWPSYRLWIMVNVLCSAIFQSRRLLMRSVHKHGRE